jgi:hypothetical protein
MNNDIRDILEKFIFDEIKDYLKENEEWPEECDKNDCYEIDSLKCDLVDAEDKISILESTVKDLEDTVISNQNNYTNITELYYHGNFDLHKLIRSIGIEECDNVISSMKNPISAQGIL